MAAYKLFWFLFRLFSGIVFLILAYQTHHGFIKWYVAAPIMGLMVIVNTWVYEKERYTPGRRRGKKRRALKKLQLTIDLVCLVMLAAAAVGGFAALAWLVIYARVGGGRWGSVAIVVSAGLFGLWWGVGFIINYLHSSWEAAKIDPAAPLFPWLSAAKDVLGWTRFLLYGAIIAGGAAWLIYLFFTPTCRLGHEAWLWPMGVAAAVGLAAEEGYGFPHLPPWARRRRRVR